MPIMKLCLCSPHESELQGLNPSHIINFIPHIFSISSCRDAYKVAGDYFTVKYSRYSGSGNKPLCRSFSSVQTSVEWFRDQSSLLNVFHPPSRESLTNLSNSDISVYPFTQWFAFFTFQLSDTDMMIHTHGRTHRGGLCYLLYLLCSNSRLITAKL